MLEVKQKLKIERLKVQKSAQNRQSIRSVHRPHFIVRAVKCKWKGKKSMGIGNGNWSLTMSGLHFRLLSVVKCDRFAIVQLMGRGRCNNISVLSREFNFGSARRVLNIQPHSNITSTSSPNAINLPLFTQNCLAGGLTLNVLVSWVGTLAVQIMSTYVSLVCCQRTGGCIGFSTIHRFASFKNCYLINNFLCIVNASRPTNENFSVSILLMVAPKSEWVENSLRDATCCVQHLHCWGNCN